ncbi:hypothetical protein D1605_002640 [Xylella fastidiosa subsp. fastidiosa]|jgi:hypothetical protein|uniref:Uncharacterized protein n=3 Tax=Xylella fastidiosa TaxID=2371 RepID=B2I8N8_XYLF2|nr:hypothetical protein [Xylella fastidiosa]ACB91949.1 hypothetical protein XfasM23_0502 [Xylella fastidiosa M23]EGO83057.1 hypothetical protein XFEB_00060 [Xylella fastidiosa EB92.1]KAF0570857.1 hypothetical protein P305_07685 [Xylella fastidiosa subsp. fastidiosa Mus-1]KGM21290.1 hypothetical protein JT24_02755 [Xylella fastidiosa]MBE0263040.1 hypothetical protein [Xylella fastidiosa subsp. fastidiosa]
MLEAMRSKIECTTLFLLNPTASPLKIGGGVKHPFAMRCYDPRVLGSHGRLLECLLLSIKVGNQAVQKDEFNGGHLNPHLLCAA